MHTYIVLRAVYCTKGCKWKGAYQILCLARQPRVGCLPAPIFGRRSFGAGRGQRKSGKDMYLRRAEVTERAKGSAVKVSWDVQQLLGASASSSFRRDSLEDFGGTGGPTAVLQRLVANRVKPKGVKRATKHKHEHHRVSECRSR